MPSQVFERKLTAIMSADVAGYNRLMGEDEEHTVRTLSSYREVMANYILQHGGRVVDSPGDNLLAEFKSVVNAVKCAVEIQRELGERNTELPDDKKMEYRIGINLGDVIQEEDRIYGDGVNVAARLETLAEPGGICISGITYDQVKKKLQLEYQFLGNKSAKNIEELIPVYRVLASTTTLGITVPKARVERMAYPLPNKPSIAVLPFSNMTGDSSQDYIGDGLSDSIISTLSKIGRMFVIAQNSSLTYKGTPVKVQQVAEELGVQYVLEGSFQKSQNRIRVTAQLIDALRGHHLWSERYDRKMEDIFELQDDITKTIVLSLHFELTRGEAAILEARSTDNLEAWSEVAKGYDLAMKSSKENLPRVRALYENATRLDPGYASAWAWLASTHAMEVVMGWSESPVDSIERANEFVQKALSVDDKDAMALITLGQIYLG
jgi:adenylate cyclase